ncbi:MAG: ABC transporter ATP-binding protein [Clostridia bacterium]|nr:ABC transporter ATP-binding protein [Clostridia bacterium]
MGPMMGGPRPMRRKEEPIPKPKSIGGVPKYIGLLIKRAAKVVSGFFSRLFYIFGLVWETRPWILFVMLGLAIVEGVMPVIKALVAAEILNRLAEAYVTARGGGEVDFMTILRPMILQFGLIFLTSVTGSVNTMVNRVSSELVVNTVKLKIIKKAKTVDMASFDKPEFYEKLENATREAGMRPIQIISAQFNIFCTIISMISFVVILWGVSPWAPVIITALALPGAIISFVYRKKSFSYMRMRSKDRRQLAYYSDVLTNKDIAKEVRMFGLSEFFTDKYKSTFKKYFAGLKKLFLGEGSWNIGLAIVSAVVNCGLFLFIAKGVADGTSQIGDYSLFTGALNSISGCVRTIVTTTATIYEGTLFIDNLISFINEPQTLVPSVDEPVKPERHIAHKIEFQDVSFRYPGASRDTIKHFTATINPGDTVV